MRAIHPYQLGFLAQDFYKQCGETSCTDYRSVYRGDLVVTECADDGEQFRFALRKN